MPSLCDTTNDDDGQIRIGIGGWTFEPWRGVFYPKGLPHAKELAYASEQLTSIEINGTFYRTQKPATYRKWASEVPDGFVFSLKGPRYATNRRVLAEAGDSIKRFLDSGVTELGDRLGPLLWQFAPTKKFDEADFGGFLELLPRQARRPHAAPCGRGAPRQLQDAGVRRAAAQVQHRRSCSPSTRNIRTSPTSPAISSIRGCRRARNDPDRLSAEGSSMHGRSGCKPGRTAASRRTCRASMRRRKPKAKPRDVFAYVIHEGKVRAPAAAMALIERLKE